MSKDFWDYRYKLLKERGIVGMMSWGDQLQKATNDYWESIKSVIEKTRDVTILDYGCGTGKYTKLLTEFFITKKYTGVDIIPEVINEMKVRRSDLTWNLISEASEIKEYYDVIWCSFVLQHLMDSDCQMTISYLLAHLNKDGRLYIINSLDTNRRDSYTFFRNSEKYISYFMQYGFQGRLLHFNNDKIGLIVGYR